MQADWSWLVPADWNQLMSADLSRPVLANLIQLVQTDGNQLALLRPASHVPREARVREAGRRLRSTKSFVLYARLLEGEASVSLSAELVSVARAGVA